MNARIAITRSQPGADILAAHLRDIGITPLIAPLLAITPLAYEPPADRNAYDAILISSHHALMAAATVYTPGTPLWVVGQNTALAAEGLGMTVRIHAPDMQQLCHAIREARPASMRILYLSGRDIHHNPAEWLPHHSITRVIVYQAERQPLPPSLAEGIAQNTITAILLQSMRTAKHFIREVERLSLTLQADLIGFSPEIADYLRQCTVTANARCHHCDSPDQSSLITLIRARYAQK